MGTSTSTDINGDGRGGEREVIVKFCTCGLLSGEWAQCLTVELVASFLYSAKADRKYVWYGVF